MNPAHASEFWITALTLFSGLLLFAVIVRNTLRPRR